MEIRVQRLFGHVGSATLLIVGLLATAGCRTGTSKLTAQQEQRFAAEQVVRRADNLMFRFSHDAGSREAGWEDRLASIIVTNQSVFLHKNEKIGIEITPESRRYYEVHRDHDRVRITAGSGQSRETWSFAPPSDPEGWATDIRAVIKASKSAPAS
ncbi:MAG: hypothetical protein ABI647_01950 [Gemmatimonadota bacterium]